MQVSMSVNGRQVSGDVESRTLLVHFLREDLRLTGTHVGCETSYCGACTVKLDGKAVLSCTMLAVQAEGADITTVEGLAQNGDLHPVQEGFWERHGLQCGFCTPGMIMSAVTLLEENDNPSEDEIRRGHRGEPLPVHRIPQHRAGNRIRRRKDARRRAGPAGMGERMSSTSVLGGVVRRREDPALIQGGGRYTDDVKLAGTTHVAFVRSPFAHAIVNSVDTSAAAEMDGVVAVYTAADVAHLGPLVAQAPVGALRPLLNNGTVKHVGEAVAMVMAEDPYLARDAADAVDVDYDPLPAVVDLKASLSDEMKVHDDLDSNLLVSWTGPFGADAGWSGSGEGGHRCPKVPGRHRGRLPGDDQPAADPGAHRTSVGDGRLPDRLREVRRLLLHPDPFGAGRGDRQVLRHGPQPGDRQGDGGGGRLRLQAQRLQRRGVGGLRLEEARASGEVDRDPPGGGQLDHPGPGMGGHRHDDRYEGRRDPRLRAGRYRRYGRLLAELHCRYPLSSAFSSGRASTGSPPTGRWTASQPTR